MAIVASGQLTIADVNDGIAGPYITLIQSSLGFTFVDTVATPATQSIAFTAVWQGITGDPVFTASNGVVLTTNVDRLGATWLIGLLAGSDEDTCYLDIGQLGASDQVTVTVSVGEYSAVCAVGRINTSTAEANATYGADWDTNLTSTPLDQIMSTDAATTLGFNPSFELWTSTYPSGWANWTGAAPTKETSTVRFGSNAVKYVCTAADLGMSAMSTWATAPMAAGAFVSGTLDMYLVSRISGLPGMLVRLFTNSGLSTYVETRVQPVATLGAWQRVPYSARVPTDSQIYGIQVYIMGSYTAMSSGAFTGTVIFDGLVMNLFDGTVDAAQLSIGGVNLIKNSRVASVATLLSGTGTLTTESGTLPDGSTGDYLKFVSTTGAVFRINNCLRGNGVYSVSTYHKVLSGTAATALDLADGLINSLASTTTWQLHRQGSISVANYTLGTYHFMDISVPSGATLHLWHPQVELSASPTNWTPAIEDIDVSITASSTKANVTDGVVTRIASPMGGTYGISSPVTGAIKIRLPVLWTSTMLQFSVDVYNYATNSSFVAVIGGYNYSSGWLQTSASIIGGAAANYTVRFGDDGVKACIWIGEVGTVWQYPQVTVKNLQLGYGSYTIAMWEAGWGVSIVTAFGTVQVTDTDNLVQASDVQKVGGTLAATVRDNASTALANAATANAALTNIASDSILSPSEKPSIVQGYSVITGEQTGIDAQATAYSITTEKTAYDNAVTALATYLGTLTGWNTVPGSDVTIVGTTFRSKFADVYTTRQALLNKIAEVAGTKATWSGTTGTGKPADNATVNNITTGLLSARPTGVNGDFYFATDTRVLYQKIAGAWVSASNLQDLSNAADVGEVYNSNCTIVGGDGRPAGVKAMYGGSDPTVVSYQDAARSIVKLYSPTDDSIGMAWPAFMVNPGTTYDVLVRVKASAASAYGFYFRISELDSDLPVGVTYLHNGTGEAGGVQHTRELYTMSENVAISTSWTIYRYAYTPTATALWACPAFFNWTGMGFAELHVDKVVVNSRATVGANASNLTAVMPLVNLAPNPSFETFSAWGSIVAINGITYPGSYVSEWLITGGGILNTGYDGASPLATLGKYGTTPCVLLSTPENTNKRRHFPGGAKLPFASGLKYRASFYVKLSAAATISVFLRLGGTDANCTNTLDTAVTLDTTWQLIEMTVNVVAVGSNPKMIEVVFSGDATITISIKQIFISQGDYKLPNTSAFVNEPSYFSLIRNQPYSGTVSNILTSTTTTPSTGAFAYTVSTLIWTLNVLRNATCFGYVSVTVPSGAAGVVVACKHYLDGSTTDIGLKTFIPALTVGAVLRCYGPFGFYVRGPTPQDSSTYSGISLEVQPCTVSGNDYVLSNWGSAHPITLVMTSATITLGL